MGRKRRTSACSPHPGKGQFELGDGGPVNLDARVAPRLEPARRVAVPLVADAKAGDEPDLAIDRNRFAMIARDPTQRAVETKWIEAAHLGARDTQLLPHARGMARPEPIVDDAHTDTGERAFCKCSDELAADHVIGNNVELEQDRAFGSLDGR